MVSTVNVKEITAQIREKCEDVKSKLHELATSFDELSKMLNLIPLKSWPKMIFGVITDKKLMYQYGQIELIAAETKTGPGIEVKYTEIIGSGWSHHHPGILTPKGIISHQTAINAHYSHASPEYRFPISTSPDLNLMDFRSSKDILRILEEINNLIKEIEKQS